VLLVIRNAHVLDVEAFAIVGPRTVVAESGVLVDVDAGDATPRAAEREEIDARGAFLLPGFIDAHVHLGSTTMDFARLARQSETERSLEMARGSERTLARGFTTVRDTGGDVRGLIAAIGRGLCAGPRVLHAGRVLSQTGGHGDLRAGRIDAAGCACQVHSDSFAHVCDGADAVLRAARVELRAGSDFLKLMASGGVASPSDPLDATQYTAAEIRAATTEAAHRHTYVTAHAYTPEAIALAIENGVSCIEHGNLLDDATARLMAEVGVVLVPTLVTYRAMRELGEKLGLPARNLEKNRGVFEAGLRSVEVARRNGVELGLGTDLLGEAQDQQADELAIRAELEPAADVLRAMYRTNARLCGMEDEIGVVKAGAHADLVLCDVDPLEELASLARTERVLSHVIQGGRVVRRRA
jgi:imidazolonepropionase-like amidohydrolase